MAKWSKGDKPWERQQGESAQAFEAFSVYLEFGPNRSIREVGRKLDKSRQQIGKWSSRWRWQDRIRAYDNELLRQKFEAEKKVAREMRERQINLAVLLQKKAFDALRALDTSELTPQEILRFISEGAKLERETRTADVDDQRTAIVESEDTGETGDVLIYLPENGRD